MSLLEKVEVAREAMHRQFFGTSYNSNFLMYEDTAIVYHPHGFEGLI
jgi:hypothetical protein